VAAEGPQLGKIVKLSCGDFGRRRIWAIKRSALASPTQERNHDIAMTEGGAIG
jgi:hypothetical protein